MNVINKIVNINKRNFSYLLILMITSLSWPAISASSYTQFGRYLSVTNAPNTDDNYGLNTIVQRQFPDYIHTTGQAIEYTLSQTAYHLLPVDKSELLIKQLYSQPLPIYLRTIGPMPLQQALLMLSGNVYQLVVDPVHRIVTYKVRQSYQNL